VNQITLERFHSCTRLAYWLTNRFVSRNADGLRAAGHEPVDVQQIGLLALFRAAEKYRPDHAAGAKFRTFASRVIRNALCNLAKEIYATMPTISPGDGFDVLDESAGPVEVAEQREIGRRVQAAVARLKPPQRAAVIGHMQGETLAAIGRADVVTREAVRQRRNRAFAWLRREFAADR
jgi:RNA polymerase sigma factor (sigma-70 family)